MIASMATLHLLGTGSVISDPWRTTTMLAVDNGVSLILVDCGGDVVQRLRHAGLDPLRVKHIVVTHEHADHCSGFPLLLERLWLHGLRGEFHVHGIRTALDQVHRIHEAFNTADWPGFPEIRWHEVEMREGAPVLDGGGWRITAAPGRHPVPCIGLRFHDLEGGGSLFYSADTEPAPTIASGAQGASLLVHEATGAWPGHSSALQAAELAAVSGAESLVLVHVPPDGPERQADLAAAQAVFPATAIGEEGGAVEF